jgi:hypothetical protein
MSSSEEAQALGRSEFWDERYAKSDGDKPTHEWFRAFDALEPFFEKYLFKERGVEGKGGRVLHLGSGDSVGSLFAFFWRRWICCHKSSSLLFLTFFICPD